MSPATRRTFGFLVIAALAVLALACSEAGSGSTSAPASDEPVRGFGSGGPVARDQPLAEEPSPIDTRGLPTFVFVDQDT